MNIFFTACCLLLFLITTIFTDSFAQVTWKKHANNPVLTTGPEGSWDSRIIFQPCVLKDSLIYDMWYFGNSVFDDIDGKGGFATSADGINWTKYQNNPILLGGGQGAWDQGIGACSVVKDDTIYHMWYTGFDGTNYRIGYARSSDKVSWTKDPGNPVLNLGADGSWDDWWVSGPSVIYDGITFHMWYCGYDGTHDRIGYATSNDGINWTKYSNNPVLELGPKGSWDDYWTSICSVIFNGYEYEMWYSGNDGMTTVRIGYATSSDGISWNRYANNPVLNVGPSGSWDDYWVWSPSVIFNGSDYEMWYQGESGNGSLVGFATAPIIDALEETDPKQLPSEFVLKQNYPNPFNPSTTIEFSIPKSEFVTLKIYNLRGQELTTLVSQRLKPGNYVYIWDASGSASGIYYYKIETGYFSQTLKMILLR